MKLKAPRHIIVSRSDGIGDVILTLPVCCVLKELFPDSKITFLGSSYTRAIAKCCKYVDNFVAWDEVSRLDEELQKSFFRDVVADTILHVFPVKEIAEIAKAAGISQRIGTKGRLYHITTCNKLVSLSRKNSLYHEAQLNLMLLKPFGINKIFTKEEIQDKFGLTNIPPLNNSLKEFLVKDKFNLLLHPRTKGSAREWGIENFSHLIKLLPQDKFRIFISGTEEEGFALKNTLINTNPHVIDITGKLTLPEFISFINSADGIVAASTGPLHIAAALGKTAIGLYAPMRPIHPGRWAPVGINASYLVLDKKCKKCKNSENCECIAAIRAEDVAAELMKKINV